MLGNLLVVRPEGAVNGEERGRAMAGPAGTSESRPLAREPVVSSYSAMSFWLLHWLPIIISALTLLVSTGALVFVARYTQITARIERASQEQAEASQKPVIVMAFEYRSDESDPVWERIEDPTRIPQSTMLKLSKESGNFLITNIGTGPALNLSFDFVPVDATEIKGRQIFCGRKLSYLREGQSTESTIGPSRLPGKDFRFVAYYESLSGKHYSTEMLLRVKDIRTILLQGNWIFRTVSPQDS
jgi:hypothetical protein